MTSNTRPTSQHLLLPTLLALAALPACDTDKGDTYTEICYLDADGDGYGTPDLALRGCDALAVSNALDCDDADPEVHPGVTETCDGLDNDCEGTTDGSDAAGISSWYADADGDGQGDPASELQSCEPPEGYVATRGDCDDTDATVSEGATELCDDIDNDCDDVTDEDIPTWYLDRDGDGYGDDETAETTCEPSDNYVAEGGDCDDADEDINPDASELCDGLDNDCDEDTDGWLAVDSARWYADADGDGYGDAATDIYACDAPEGYTDADTDCDDADATTHPDAEERCDDEDDDCDDESDEDAIDAATWYADTDGDTFGDPAVSTTSCEAPEGYVADNTDCDDSEADEGWPTWYLDRDEDGYGDDETTESACEPSAYYVTEGGDCDDADEAIKPDATEVCDGLDNDCDGDTDGWLAVDGARWYADADGDGYGDAATDTYACDAPDGYIGDDMDCDDADATAHPGAGETCDDTDDDCDGETDEDAADAPTWYTDTDGDGYGDAVSTIAACDAPEGHVADNTDCDDTDAAVSPGATELCDELDADEDCDGLTDDEDDSVSEASMTTWHKDDDGDGYGSDARGEPMTACEAPSGYVDDATDCDDADVKIWPEAPETCDGLDNDCDDADGWTEDEEYGVVSLRLDGETMWTDLTKTFGAATEEDVVVYTLDSDGELVFCDGYYYTSLVLSAPNTAVTGRNGPDATTLDAAGVTRVVRIAEYTESTIQGLTLTGGSSHQGGGLMAADGSKATLTNLVITGNEAHIHEGTYGYGGGIYALANEVALTDVIVADNEAVTGGGLRLDDGTYTLYNVLVQGNYAHVAGGGIYNYGRADLTCTDATAYGVMGNDAGDNGDGLVQRGQIDDDDYTSYSYFTSVGCGWSDNDISDVSTANSGSKRYQTVEDTFGTDRFTCEWGKECYSGTPPSL